MEKGQEQLTIPPSTRTVGARLRPSLRVGVPGVFMPRRLGLAWALSLVVHGSILVLALWGSGNKVVAPAPTVHLVFVAPPPPSPPLGIPEGKGSAPITETPPQKMEKPPPPLTAKVIPPKRLVPLKQVVKLKKLKPSPPVASEPRVSPPAPPSVEEPRTDVVTGRVEGGVAGGVIGGTIGGVVSGLIAAPLRVDQVAHPPVLVSRVEPDYPESARLREIEGRVVLEAIVDREGQVEAKIKVLQSVAVLDNAAIAAVKQWRFTPGRNESGQAVRVILEVPVRFMLE